MKIIEPSISIETEANQSTILSHLEKAGRVCYKSESNISTDSAEKFILSIIKRGHESVIEHFSITVRVICDRGISHEIVRHRIASYSQESTRYCNYHTEKFSNEIICIRPCFWKADSKEFEIWKKSMEDAERTYMRLIKMGAAPQEARSVLPNSLKTELLITMNLREWRHFLKLRTDLAAHPQMREITLMILDEFTERYPVFFNDIKRSLIG